MASAKTAVRVLDRGMEVEAAIRRPVRLTPDGYAGVAYAGSVYALHVDDVIDLSGPSWEIADCDRFLFAGADIPYAPTSDDVDDVIKGFDIDWYLESNQYGHYVVFNAPERVASRLVDALEAADLSVQRWDVSHRQAGNGNFYDWFTRLRFKGGRDEALALVGAVISPPAVAEPVTAPVDPTAARLADAEARVEELLDQLYALSRRAEAAKREVAHLRGAVASAEANERGHREALALAERRRSDLQSQLATLRESVGSGPDTAELVRSRADAEELRELALAENATLLDRASSSELEAEEQRSRADDLADQVEALVDRVAELEALETERLRAATANRPRRGGVAEFLPIAFSRLDFILDAVDVLANLESPSSTMRALAEIDAGQLVGKDLEGMPGWFEVTKLATGIAGSQRLGRIYYKPNGGRVLVSVHIKQDEKQQKRHIDRLRAV
ncbi:hypothetical protein [Sphaerisporangium perillae]|uniref:hypothetical protein n=1 Tax=Sphaerisporangium perillae TaxID=2935860 RepID=UPI00200E8C5A|nr:hypothetical protein [Sphaerisporangium perillae]